MGRTAAVIWHASFSIIAAGLYFFFVLPRWWELTGFTSHTLGTVLRIVTAVLIALAALPVVFTLLRTRKPEYAVPQLALRMRVWSILAHVLAGVLIAGTAISEIWLPLDRAGQWLFGVYGAAAAVALLGIGAFYLSFVAELPPPPPKPKKAGKPKKSKQRRRFRKKGEGAESAEGAEGTEEAPGEAEEVTEAAESETPESETIEPAETAETQAAETETLDTEVAEDETQAAETETLDTEVAEDETQAADTGAEGTEPGTADTADASDTELLHSAGRHRMPSGKRRKK